MFEVRYLRLPIARRVILLALAAWFFGAFGLLAQSPNPDADLQPPPIPPEEVPTPTPIFAPAPPPHHAGNVGAVPVVPAMTPVATPARKAIEPLVVVGHPSGVTPNYGREGNQRAAKLRSYTPQSYTFDRASLRDVLRLLAEDAGLPYIGIPEHSPKAQRLVTFKMTAPPFIALESLTKQNDIKLDYEDGVWFMRVKDANFERFRTVEDANELVGIIYQLKYDTSDRVDFRPGSGGAANNNAGTSGNTAPTTPNMPLQNSQRVFEAKAPRLINDIRVMLGLRPLQYNADGTLVYPEVEGQKNEAQQRTPLPPSDGALLSLEAGGSNNATPVEGNLLPVYVPPQRPQVIYNSDNNLLWVVATRKQHKWVADYLSKVDKPQDLIAIEVKFVETKKNPQVDFGINWENTLGRGITLRGRASTGITGQYGFGFDRNNTTTSQYNNLYQSGNTNAAGNNILNAISNAISHGQTNLTITDIINNSATRSQNTLSQSSQSTIRSITDQLTRNNLATDFRGQTTTVPYEAVLNMDEVSVTLQAFMQDRDTSLVQYPRVLTMNNREVAITAAENTPVNAGVSQTQSGTAATQTGTLGYLPTGTQINILPKVLGKSQISMTVAITISSIVGTTALNLGTGLNLYPITSQRVYNATLQVDSGYTLAVGGLEKVADSNVQGGVPILKDIPALGYFFKNKSKSRDRINLIIFITPYLISDMAKTSGLPEDLQSIVPQVPGAAPEPPAFAPDGRLVGGEAAVDAALQWLDYQRQYFHNMNEEGLDDATSVKKLREVISVARALVDALASIASGISNEPTSLTATQLARAQSMLVQLNRVLAQAQKPAL